MLTQQILKSLLSYNPESGIFSWLVDVPGRKSGEIAGHIDQRGYVQISIKLKVHRAHRLAFLYMTGSFPESIVDHINGIKSDNRWINLRAVTHSGNLQNQKVKHSNNTSGLLGVYSKDGKWASQISVDGKVKHLGTFQTKEIAYEAYLNAKRILHSTCTI